MARSPWLLSDADRNPNFRRRWTEPDWILRMDKRMPAAASTANRPLENPVNPAFDYSRTNRALKARRAAEALFSRITL